MWKWIVACFDLDTIAPPQLHATLAIKARVCGASAVPRNADFEKKGVTQDHRPKRQRVWADGREHYARDAWMGERPTGGQRVGGRASWRREDAAIRLNNGEE